MAEPSLYHTIGANYANRRSPDPSSLEAAQLRSIDGVDAVRLSELDGRDGVDAKIRRTEGKYPGG